MEIKLIKNKMVMKNIIYWILMLMSLLLICFSCKKEPLQKCNCIGFISDFYYSDSTYYYSDTSTFDYGCVDDSDIIKIKATPDMWWNLCYNTPPLIEHCRYVVNGKTIYPFVDFKK